MQSLCAMVDLIESMRTARVACHGLIRRVDATDNHGAVVGLLDVLSSVEVVEKLRGRVGGNISPHNTRHTAHSIQTERHSHSTQHSNRTAIHLDQPRLPVFDDAIAVGAHGCVDG